MTIYIDHDETLVVGCFLHCSLETTRKVCTNRKEMWEKHWKIQPLIVYYNVKGRTHELGKVFSRNNFRLILNQFNVGRQYSSLH